MLRLPPWLVVVAAWAAIYLPALGSFEIKGEEGRRILPAIAMMENGDYVVPRVGGEAYFSKPPLVNWLVAASFRIFGIRNEWTARLPSALSILAVAIVFVTVGGGALGKKGGMIAALIWLTTIGMIEKGRLIEIEALYVSLCALAMICWLSWWQEQRSPWLTWVVPWIFLGLGLLAKGPVLLLFFYTLVAAVLWQTKRWKEFFHPAHLLGVLLMIGIFSAWAIPFAKMSGQSRAVHKWSDQVSGRMTLHFFSFRVWVATIARAIGQFLPWIAFVPLLRFSKFREQGQRRLAHALVWSVIAPVIVISAVPSAAPRYSLPVLAPFCWLMALSFVEDVFARPTWLARADQSLWQRCGRVIVAIVGGAVLIGYPVAAAVTKDREKVRSVAMQINAVVPESETLYAVDPNYQPFLFYMRAHVVYLGRLEEVPVSARYFLVRPNNEEPALRSEQWSPRKPQPVLRVPDYRNETVILFEVPELR
jgi:4-amino-4-deoxy-L-arabinose transferase-like glycosyltransferase